MNYGLYLSASGVLNNLHRQDVLTNNLANVETTGFKPNLVVTRQREPERLESGVPAEPQWLLEQLGGGLLQDRSRVELRPASLKATGGPLDLAIQGDGFFVVAGAADEGAGDVRLTRDGRFSTSEEGVLVMAANGRAVLDGDDRPIHVAGSGPLDVDADGTLKRNGRTIGRLQIAAVDPDQLVKTGDNLLRTSGPRGVADGAVQQGYLEDSAVDAVLTLSQLITTSRAVEANARMMQYHDFIMGQAVNTFGRVA